MRKRKMKYAAAIFALAIGLSAGSGLLTAAGQNACTREVTGQSAVIQTTSVPTTAGQKAGSQEVTGKPAEFVQIGLDPAWQYAVFSEINTGYAVLYKADGDRRKNLTVAVNAGHGTEGGSSVKTYCHPDKTPKVTGGTSKVGAVMAVAV